MHACWRQSGAGRTSSGGRLLVALLLPIVAGLLACGGAHTETYTNLDRDAEPVRSRFNADVGKVRLMLLLSPT
jgi:hypothetical protein